MWPVAACRGSRVSCSRGRGGLPRLISQAPTPPRRPAGAVPPRPPRACRCRSKECVERDHRVQKEISRERYTYTVRPYEASGRPLSFSQLPSETIRLYDFHARINILLSCLEMKSCAPLITAGLFVALPVPALLPASPARRTSAPPRRPAPAVPAAQIPTPCDLARTPS